MINVREDKGRGDKGNHFQHESGNSHVYVGNLSFEVNWRDLKTHMSQAGYVIHADVLISADGRSRGCGVVEVRTYISFSYAGLI